MLIKKYLVFLLVLIIIFSVVKVKGREGFKTREGFITEVNLDRQALKIKNNWYFLQEKTIIKRNNIKGTLKSCRPISDKNYQWAQLKFDSNHKLGKLTVKYYILEGNIIDIDYWTKTIKLKVFKVPKTFKKADRQEVIKLTVNRDNILRELRIRHHIVLVTNGNEILKVKRLN